MAELLLRVGDSVAADRSQDGDIICAFNARRIKCVYAQHVCHVKKFGFNSDGLRPDSLAKMFFEETCQYRFERLSRNEVRRITLATMAVDVYSDVPNAKGKSINVGEYLRRRKLSGERSKVFGFAGVEVWYGGRTDVSDAPLTRIWSAIETATSLREVDHRLWPLSDWEKRQFYSVRVSEFSDQRAVEMTEPEIDTLPDGGETIVKKHKRWVDWRNDLGLTGREKTDVQDANLTIDHRDRAPASEDTIVRVKT